MRKLLVIWVMVAGFVHVAMADNQNVIKEVITSERAPRFEEVNINEVPEVVMNAFDASYQNIGIEKIEMGEVAHVLVYRFTIITYERKELTVYFTQTGEEIKI